MRNKKGQFIKGVRSHPETEFKKGQHWRPARAFREKAWLEREYVEKRRSSGDIAQEFGLTEGAITFWLQRHGIPRRSVAEARAVKHWGSKGQANSMYGRSGVSNPHWKGGITAERQAFYSSQAWADAVKQVWQRDQATCQRCGKQANGHGGPGFHIHHIVPFCAKELRAELSNLVLLCDECHRWVHSRANVNKDFIKQGKS